MHPLDGPRLRLAAAQARIKALEHAIESRRKRHPHKLIAGPVGLDGWQSVYSDTTELYDPSWGIDVGEIAHNLRAALDNLAWQVALRYSETPSKRTQFPINLCRSADKDRASFEKDSLVQLKNIPIEVRALFESQQPYQEGRGGSADPLYLLKEVNDVDKHRIVHLTAFAPLSGKVEIVDTTNGSVAESEEVQFEEGFDLRGLVQVSRMRPVHEPYERRIVIRVQVSFGHHSGAASMLPLTTTLHHMFKRTSEIVSSFESFFR